MSETEKTFSIQIKTRAEMSAVEQTIASLEKQIIKAKLAGEAYGDLEKKLAALNDAAKRFKFPQQLSDARELPFQKTSQELKKNQQEIASVGQAAEHATGHVHQFHKLIHALNEIAPGTGILLEYMFKPTTAAITVGATVLKLFHERLKEVNEQLDKMAEENAKPLTNRLDLQRESVIELAKSHGELNERLRHTAHSEETLAQNTEYAIGIIKRQAEAAASIRDASKDREIAELDSLHAMGLAQTDQYEAAKLAIEEKYRRKKIEADQNALAAEIAAKKYAIETAEQAKGGLEKAANAAVITRINDEVNAADAANEVTASHDRLIEAKAKLKEWMDKPEIGRGLAHHEREFKEVGNRQTLTKSEEQMYGNVFVDLFNKRNELEANVARAQEAFDHSPRSAGVRRAVADESARASERASKRAEDNADFIEQTQREVGRLEAQLGDKKKADAAIDKQESAAARAKLKGTPLGASVGGGAEALQRLMKGQHFDLTEAEDRKRLLDLHDLAKTLSGLPSHDPRRPEVPNTAGAGFGTQADRIIQSSMHDALAQGKRLDTATTQTANEIGALLRGLHGKQADMLQQIAANADDGLKLAGNVADIANKQAEMKRVLEYMHTRIQDGYNR